MSDEWPVGFSDIKWSSVQHTGPRWWQLWRRLKAWRTRKIMKLWKIVEGPSTFIDGTGLTQEDGRQWVYHYAPPTRGKPETFHSQLLADHPWDDSYEASICPYCHPKEATP